MDIYALHMHKHARARTGRAPVDLRAARLRLSTTHVVRGAVSGDAGDIHDLVAPFAERGLLLPRTREEIETSIDDYAVVVDAHGRLLACAALYEYSPSLGEVGSVAVHEAEHGKGLGTLAVQAVEAMARRRGIDELFALSLAGGFFESLGWSRTELARYPEKLRQYERLAQGGHRVVPKPCYHTRLGEALPLRRVAGSRA
jgi:amino-acid N-acetyltransferase